MAWRGHHGGHGGVWALPGRGPAVSPCSDGGTVHTRGRVPALLPPAWLLLAACPGLGTNIPEQPNRARAGQHGNAADAQPCVGRRAADSPGSVSGRNRSQQSWGHVLVFPWGIWMK